MLLPSKENPFVSEAVFIFVICNIVYVDAWRLTVYCQVNECVRVCKLKTVILWL